MEFNRQLSTGFGAQRTGLNQRDLVSNVSALTGKGNNSLGEIV